MALAKVNRKELIYLLTPIVANTYFVLGANAFSAFFHPKQNIPEIDNNCLKKSSVSTCI